MHHAAERDEEIRGDGDLCLNTQMRPDAKTICELLSREVAEWATGAEECDDMTLLGLSVH
jgi:serine phosphatase RsbU (regulator of sigma subunit)